MKSTIKSERLEARISTSVMERLKRAAELSGQSVSAFLVASASAAAEQTILAHEAIQLREQDCEAFANALLNPPEPTEQLRQCVRQHRCRVEK